MSSLIRRSLAVMPPSDADDASENVGFGNVPIVKVACAPAYAAALDAQGTVWTWSDAQPGVHDGLPTREDSLCDEGVRIVDIGCCEYSMLAVADTGAVYGWRGRYGKLPTLVHAFPLQYEETDRESFEVGVPRRAVRVFCGQSFWGAVDDQGFAAITMRTRPVPLPPRVCAERVVALACGSQTCLALTAAGRVYTLTISPQAVDYVCEAALLTDLLAVRIVQIAMGDSHALALDDHGFVRRVWFWLGVH